MVGLLPLKFAFLRMKDKPGATAVVFPEKKKRKKEVEISNIV